ncbi:MAG: ectoine hydroxylase [FCB group bacterium]|jgi:ectoine hydroxylase|nr:ectoine hydroxylase [FCB group bacterium]
MQTMKDMYESRTRELPRLSERMEPVLYGGPEAPGPLTGEQLQQYDQNGFLLFPRFFDAEMVGRLQEELERLRGLAAIRRSPVAILEPKSREIRSIFAVHRLSKVYGALAGYPRLMDMAEQILASAVYIHQSRVNLKPGFDGKEFYWHSDFETWHVEDGMPQMRALSCIVALTENRETNGALMVIPGSHKKYVACVGKAPENHFKTSLQQQVFGVPDTGSIAALADAGGIASFTGPPGTVALFDCNLLHGSNSNITPLPRSNVFFVYNSVKNVLMDPFGGAPPRPDYLASRKFVPLRSNGLNR